MASPGPDSHHVALGRMLSLRKFVLPAHGRDEDLAGLHGKHEWLYPELISEGASDVEDSPQGNDIGLGLKEKPSGSIPAPFAPMEESPELIEMSTEADIPPLGSKAKPNEWVDLPLVRKRPRLGSMDDIEGAIEMSIKLKNMPDESKINSLERSNNQLQFKEQRPSRPSRIWRLPLTPIEQNAPRQHKRISMLVEFNPPDPDSMFTYQLELQEAQETISNAFFQTLRYWPFLGGNFRPHEANPNLLNLDFREAFCKREQAHLFSGLSCLENSDLFKEVWMKGAKLHELESLYDVPFDDLEKVTLVPKDEDTSRPLQPVSLRLGIVKGALVLAFSFCEVIFDLAFIENFFSRFFTHIRLRYPDEHPELNATLTRRQVPVGSPSEDVDLESFKIYDWGIGNNETPSPAQNLSSFTIFITSHAAIVSFEECQRILRERDNNGGCIYVQDCVLATIWVNVMRARFINKRVEEDVITRMNITVPGVTMARRPKGLTEQHFGNSSVSTVAICGPGFTAYEREVSFVDYALAAQHIRKAINRVNLKYIQDLTTVKRNIPGPEDREAYNRAMSAETFTFEDWTSLGADKEAHVPHIQDNRPYFLPCGEDMREGQIIFLPRKGGYWSTEPWRISICLSEDDMERVLADLAELGFSG